LPNTPLAQVAELAGFGSEESLRRHFRRFVSISPGAYRKKFGNNALTSRFMIFP